jgi:hypothetical protein
MATALSQHVSHAGHTYSNHARNVRAPDSVTGHGSPLTIFTGFAAATSLLLVTGSALGSVAYLAHLINTSWQLL